MNGGGSGKTELGLSAPTLGVSPLQSPPARYRPARLTHTGGGHSGRHVDGNRFGAQLPGDRPGDRPQPPAGPHEQARPSWRRPGEAPGQPGPSLEHDIQTAGSSPVPGTERTPRGRGEYPRRHRARRERGRDRHQVRAPVSRVGGDLDVTSVLELARPLGPAPAHRTPQPPGLAGSRRRPQRRPEGPAQ
jgi:hypothetical protein